MLFTSTPVRTGQDGGTTDDVQTFGTACFDTPPASRTAFHEDSGNPFVGHVHSCTMLVPRKDSGVAHDAVM